MHSIEIVLALVALGAVGAAFANRLRIPPPSLLVLAGLIVGLLPGFPRCGSARMWSVSWCCRRCCGRPLRISVA